MTEHSWSEYMRLVLEQLRVNTESIKEMGTNYHELRNKVNEIVGDVQLTFQRQIAELKFANQQNLNDKLREVEHEVEAKIQEASAELNKKIDEISKEVAKANNAITALQVKAGLFGLMGSLLGFLLVYLAKLLP